jgi:hypothetical protein
MNLLFLCIRDRKMHCAPFPRLQDLLGRSSVETTGIYTHVMKKAGIGVRSPLDQQGMALEEAPVAYRVSPIREQFPRTDQNRRYLLADSPRGLCEAAN